MNPTGLYVYGVLPADHPCVLTGLLGVGDTGQPPRRVAVGSLAAVVSGAPADLRARLRDVATHQRVLTELLDQGSVLPMRFGTVWPDEDTLRADLVARADRYRELLGDLSGRVELNVRVVPDAEQMLRTVASTDDVLRRLAEPDVYSLDSRTELGEVVARALRDRQDADAQEVLRSLDPMAVRSAVGPAAEGTMLDAGFLVERAEAAAFAAAVDAVGRRLGARVRLHCAGPLPPYSFVPDEAG